MARPIKQGVDYFPLDVHLDDKFKFVEIKYKLEGFAVVVKIMQRIYSQGYWCKWSDDEMLLFSDEIKADYELVENVTKECLKREVFSSEMHEKYEILTSTGIQKRYKEIVRRRKGVDVMEEYLLIDGIFGVNDDINLVNDDINPTLSSQNDGKSTQTKVNKTKENNIKPLSHKFSISDMENAKLLFDLMQQNNPDVKKPNFDKWANDFRLMANEKIELPDGSKKLKRTDKHIKWMIQWTQQDSFWKSNILSPSKLRKQWDQLVLKAKAEHERKNQLQIGQPKIKAEDFDLDD